MTSEQWKKNIQYFKSDKQNIDNSVILIIKTKPIITIACKFLQNISQKRSWSQMEYLRYMFICCPSATGPQHSAIPRGNPPTHRLPAFPGLGKCRIKKTRQCFFTAWCTPILPSHLLTEPTYWKLILIIIYIYKNKNAGLIPYKYLVWYKTSACSIRTLEIKDYLRSVANLRCYITNWWCATYGICSKAN